jgi:hypothetical protein
MQQRKAPLLPPQPLLMRQLTAQTLPAPKSSSSSSRASPAM